ncbi:hypothetical protein [Nocardia jejuensis]|nr:hypothetical protein [Nocardia jejuensis]
MDSNIDGNRRTSDRDQPPGSGDAPWDNGHSDKAQRASRLPFTPGH